MNRIHLGNRVFTEKHGKVKIAHGPYSGHLRPFVTYMRNFDGTRSIRLVHVPHELADFDHDMWMQRRTRVANRQHARDVRDALAEPVVVREVSCISEVSASTISLGTECGVELHYNENGQLSCASYGGA